MTIFGQVNTPPSLSSHVKAAGTPPFSGQMLRRPKTATTKRCGTSTESEVRVEQTFINSGPLWRQLLYLCRPYLGRLTTERHICRWLQRRKRWEGPPCGKPYRRLPLQAMDWKRRCNPVTKLSKARLKNDRGAKMQAVNLYNSAIATCIKAGDTHPRAQIRITTLPDRSTQNRHLPETIDFIAGGLILSQAHVALTKG